MVPCPAVSRRGKIPVVDNPIGLGVIFINVLCDQLGIPLPAVPTLVVAGALAADGRLPAAAVFALGVCACLIGDGTWYVAGRLFGGRVMKLLCRISLTPDTCVNDTQSSFERWGAKVLIVAKFIPGLSLVAPPLAGATHMTAARFVLYSTLGAMLWVGAALLGGMLLKPQIDALLPHVAALGGASVAAILAVLALYIAYKWWQRWRFYNALSMARISVEELYQHMEAGAAPVVIDVRSATARGLESRRIPGALHVPVAEMRAQVGKLPRDRDVILYCTCPNEASAAQAARLLMSHGFRRVRPLRGGLDAWIAAGYAVEQIPVVAAAPPVATRGAGTAS
jgi:membrane protein DedA with SNARE-associated domain/rhodanese-related sulfurtransferase